MSAEPIATFESSLDDLGVDLVRTTAEEFASTLAPLLDPLAVGTPLLFEGVSLPETVETDPTVAELDAAATGITAAGYAVADYGSVVVQGGAEGAEPVSLYADELVEYARTHDARSDAMM